MSDEALRTLADRAGIRSDWVDYRGEAKVVKPDTLRTLLEAMDLPCATAAQVRDSHAQLLTREQQRELPPMLTATAGQSLTVGKFGDAAASAQLVLETGDARTLKLESGRLPLPADLAPGYHRLHCGDRDTTIAVAPPRAFGVADATRGRRVWGLAAQLYGLRREGGGGIGDFHALRDLAERLAARGADALAISPVHALFAADPAHFSPYAPSSRLFLNILHADPALVFGSQPLRETITSLGLGDELIRLERQSMIDWPAAGGARLKLLRAVHARLAARLDDARDPLAIEFARFVDGGGEALRDHACFEALHAQQFASGNWSWRDWPTALRDPRSAAVEAFAQSEHRELQFHLFAQWLAARGLADAQRAARDAGMAIGLIGDLAVGTSSGGSHAWSRQRDMLNGLSVGAPPDLLNALGQSWGLSTFSPRALQEHGYAAFIEMLRTALRHVGGLRIDHVLGLRRLWLVPEGANPIEGAYLRYPLDDLLRLIALESHRHRAVIVGEDLGTVPEGFRDELYAAGVLGMRVLWFERDHGLYVDPSRWPREAMATTTTHDLPTVAGWWQGRDIDWRAQLALFAPGGSEHEDRAARREDRQRMWAAFQHAGVAEAGAALPASDDAAAVIDAALQFVAKTPSPLAIVPLEDIAGLVEQPNLPGTTGEHPNWRRRMPETAAELLDADDAARRLAGLHRERPRTST